MKFCSICGHANEDNMRLCVNCGNMLQDGEAYSMPTAQAAPGYQPPVQSGYQTPVQPAYQTPAYQDPAQPGVPVYVAPAPKKKSKMPLIIGIAIAVVAIAIVVVLAVMIVENSGGSNSSGGSGGSNSSNYDLEEYTYNELTMDVPTGMEDANYMGSGVDFLLEGEDLAITGIVQLFDDYSGLEETGQREYAELSAEEIEASGGTAGQVYGNDSDGYSYFTYEQNGVEGLAAIYKVDDAFWIIIIGSEDMDKDLCIEILDSARFG